MLCEEKEVLIWTEPGRLQVTILLLQAGKPIGMKSQRPRGQKGLFASSCLLRARRCVHLHITQLRYIERNCLRKHYGHP